MKDLQFAGIKIPRRFFYFETFIAKIRQYFPKMAEGMVFVERLESILGSIRVAILAKYVLFFFPQQKQ